MKINVLPQSIANMIAAGEVVERPASVVKELAENSIDAGAKSVTIEIKQGGMSYIRVTDDGSGIPRDQAKTAFLRHATSKIVKAEDLNAIYTLGFRGEALASIAAVARVDAFTKTKDEDFGICLSIEGGEVISESEAGCADGTTIIVKDLFFNTPARMKFLKSDRVETGYVTDIVNKLILGHPEVKFRLIVNGKVAASSQGDSLLKSAIYCVYGKDFIPHLLPVSYKEEGIEITGFIGNNAIGRKDRRGQVFFINSRYITSKIISAALGEAFVNSIMTGKFPVAFLNIRVSGSFVDVNVHPTKIEVRFSDEKKVYHSIYWAVKNALSEKKHIPEITLSAKDKVREEKIKMQNSATQLDINLLRDSFYSEEKTAFTEKNKASTSPKGKAAEALGDDIPLHIKENVFFSKKDLTTLHAPVGQTQSVPHPGESISEALKKAENKEDKNIVPSASKEERVISDREITGDVQKAEGISNPLHGAVEDAKENSAILPDTSGETLKEQIAPKDESTDNQHKPHLPMMKAGVDFILVGQVFATYILLQKDNEMLIIDQHAAQERIFFEELMADFEAKDIYSQRLLIPAAVDLEPTRFPIVWENREYLESLGFECDEFGESTVLLRSVPAILSDVDIEATFREIVTLLEKGCESITKALTEDILHTMACKRAIKGNQTLGVKEMESLAEKVLSFDYINTCPHGRPICISMSKYEMEKQFKRVQ